jgi:hypothetical protein
MYLVNTQRGFLTKKRRDGSWYIDPDARRAHCFTTFEEADREAKNAVYDWHSQWFAILTPAFE